MPSNTDFKSRVNHGRRALGCRFGSMPGLMLRTVSVLTSVKHPGPVRWGPHLALEDLEPQCGYLAGCRGLWRVAGCGELWSVVEGCRLW